MDIIFKSNQAQAALDEFRQTIHNLSAFDSADVAGWANQMAHLEGIALVWARLRLTTEHFERQGLPISDAAILETITEILTSGADDTWSGRANDVRRARFDGVRRACSDIKYTL